MSAIGILSSAFFNSPVNFAAQALHQRAQQFRQELQQLGQDLQSGNLSAAQSDFAALQQLKPPSSTSSTQNSNPVAQDLNQLAQDLQSGNLPAAQQDYAQLAQDLQTQAAHGHHRHHHAGGADQGQSSPISQLLNQLGQALQSGNLSAAQQAYTTLQQDFQQFTQPSVSSSSSGISVNA